MSLKPKSSTSEGKTDHLKDFMVQKYILKLSLLVFNSADEKERSRTTSDASRGFETAGNPLNTNTSAAQTGLCPNMAAIVIKTPADEGAASRSSCLTGPRRLSCYSQRFYWFHWLLCQVSVCDFTGSSFDSFLILQAIHMFLTCIRSRCKPDSGRDTKHSHHVSPSSTGAEWWSERRSKVMHED